MVASYFRPTVTITAGAMLDHSKMVGIVPTLLAPANVERVGMIIQNNSETNALWWGYDNSIAIGDVGSFCIEPRKFYNFPTNGVYTGAIYCLSDGGGKVTCKSWNAE